MNRLYHYLFLTLSWLASDGLQAHPGIGLVYDGEQWIYYTDLKQVWRVDTKTGQKEIAIPKVHTHELCLGNEQSIYGEHFWYLPTTEKFKNYIWKYHPSQGLQIIRPELDGENNDFSFVRDRLFRAYDIREGEDQTLIIRRDEQKEIVLQQNTLKEIRWKYSTPNGQLYFVADTDLYRFSESTGLELLASDLGNRRFPFSFVRDQHQIYGIWTDRQDHVYVAIYGGRTVKKISPNKKAQTYLQTSFFWSPLNGVFDQEQNLWLLEANLKGKVRLRKIPSQDLASLKNPGNTWIYLTSSVVLLGLGVGIWWLRWRSTVTVARSIPS